MIGPVWVRYPLLDHASVMGGKREGGKVIEKNDPPGWSWKFLSEEMAV